MDEEKNRTEQNREKERKEREREKASRAEAFAGEKECIRGEGKQWGFPEARPLRLGWLGLGSCKPWGVSPSRVSAEDGGWCCSQSPGFTQHLPECEAPDVAHVGAAAPVAHGAREGGTRSPRPTPQGGEAPVGDRRPASPWEPQAGAILSAATPAAADIRGPAASSSTAGSLPLCQPAGELPARYPASEQGTLKGLASLPSPLGALCF